MLIMVAIPYGLAMFFIDPYNLLRTDLKGKSLPNYHLYSYNYLNHYDKIDYAFLGSSVVNYYDVNKMYDNGNRFCMGIESSTVEEQIAFGKTLASKQPKEIVFFLSFYSFNPSRNPETYFNENIVACNNKVVNFIYQYFNLNAYKATLKYIQEGRKNNLWMQEFNLNGSRTQNHYLHKNNYSFDKTLTEYLTLNYADIRLYGSKTFKNPGSVDDKIKLIRDFRDYLKEKGITLKIAFAPDHRLNTVMVYKMGLGATFEHLRKSILEIQPFYELNADTAFTKQDANYWDAHHVRNSERIIADLNSTEYFVTKKNLNVIIQRLKPNNTETAQLNSIFENFKEWPRIYKEAKEDSLLNPPKFP